MVRSRIAEIMSAVGVDHGRVGVEVLYKLPAPIVGAYELLWDLSVYGEGSAEVDGGTDRSSRADEVAVAGDPKNRGGGSGGRTRDTERSRERMGEVVVRSGGSARRGQRGASRGSGGRAVGVAGSAEIQEIRSRADKRLRAIARDVLAELSALGVGVDEGSGEMMVRVRHIEGVGRVETFDTTGGNAIRDAIDATKNRTT